MLTTHRCCSPLRRTAEREELSVRALARRFNTHRRTVRHALGSPVPPPRKPSPERVSPVLDPWKATIDAWLMADLDAPKKQRHTARRIWQRLVDEHGADLGESMPGALATHCADAPVQRLAKLKVSTRSGLAARIAAVREDQPSGL